MRLRLRSDGTCLTSGHVGGVEEPNTSQGSQPVLRHQRRRRAVLIAVGGLLGMMLLVQLVPYGRAHTNPATTSEPRWDSPRTRALALRACGDCHSAKTTWPWYSNIAPVSWLVQRDVDSGRKALDFSAWDRPQDAGAGDIVEQVQGGSMPPWYYTILHRHASLSPNDRTQLVRGLQATLAASPPVGGG